MHTHLRGALHLSVAVMLSLLLATAPLLGAVASGVDSVTVSTAPLSTIAASQNGMVRVMLSSLGNPTTLTLTVTGSYSLSNGTALTLGETLTVGFSSATGAITLTRGGVKTNMGTYFALRRHAASGSNGILIAQARKPTNPYPGDISFRAVQQSAGGYKLYTVAHVYIEDYLYGVLPYEMGSGAHAEALKAQAVAARTYTVRMMSSRASGYYDVVDTTSDQVYNGTPSANSSCEAAVNATKGIVLRYGSSFTATYYSASNGGQTESIQNIWGTTGLAYLGVKDDPFDYANPDSTVKKATVYGEGGANGTALVSLLKSKAVAGLQSTGYVATTANTSVQNIHNIAVHTPLYAPPSKLYTKMDFTLGVTTQTTGGAMTSATVTVTVGIFTELESLLGMSIQSGKNELWSVVRSGANFSLQARRYGHGLGMSQRGAMYMGKLGYTYAQILGFYFEGSTRVGYPFTNTILAAGSGDTVTTQEPSAQVEDDANGSVTAVVSVVSSNGSLAIRQSRSTTASVLGVVSNSSPVTVYESDGTWCLIGFGGIIGYVPINALVISGTPAAISTQAVTVVEGFATVTANGYLNLRSSGSYSAAILTTAPTGVILTVFSRSGGWAKVQYGATVAYASLDYLTFATTYGGTAVSTGSGAATVQSTDGATVALRDSANTAGTVLAQLTQGSAVTVTRDDGSWSYVTYQSMAGYIPTSNILYTRDAETEDTGTTDDQPSTTEPMATISTTVGFLRLSPDENAAMLIGIPKGQSVVLLDRGDPWCTVRYEGATGYLLTTQLDLPQTATETEQITTAVVTTQSGSLNMRQEGKAGSTILTTIPKGATVSVLSQGQTWCSVGYTGLTGYVMTAYLTFAGNGATGTDGAVTEPDTTVTTATVTTASGSLNLRAQAKAGSTILRTIPRLAAVSVATRGSEWSAITYAGISGYVMTVFLTFDTVAITATATPTAIPTATAEGTGLATDTPAPTVTVTGSVVTATVTTASGSLNLRAAQSSSAAILTTIPQYTVINVYEKGDAWCGVTYAGYAGYVLSTYLTFSSVAVTVALTATPTTAGATAVAWVYTSAGSLNLRAAASTSAAIVAIIPRLTQVTLLSPGETWTQVQYGTQIGYVMAAYLTTAKPAELGVGSATVTQPLSQTDTPTPMPTPTASPTPAPATTVAEDPTFRVPVTPLYATIQPKDDAATYPLWEGCTEEQGRLLDMLKSAQVQVLRLGDTWCEILYFNQKGFCRTEGLTLLGN